MQEKLHYAQSTPYKEIERKHSNTGEQPAGPSPRTLNLILFTIRVWGKGFQIVCSVLPKVGRAVL